ncbi:TPA_asm: trp operon leader peptide [Salmonella enterica subsp. salamae serovar 18:z10:z6]|uniref:trp operon leader peptide n=1 Tax=Salmonella enterica subsp. salamae serovar 18:z10:z6 TaxID=1967614 RepID=A0A732CXE6_SALER|nr:trp operon leader peptide [Salmonella enterica subsp. salamae serovar 18:z10:z6]
MAATFVLHGWWCTS